MGQLESRGVRAQAERMAVAVLPLVVLVVGALLYALPLDPKVNEMGRIAFFVGLFWLVYSFAGHSVRF